MKQSQIQEEGESGYSKVLANSLAAAVFMYIHSFHQENETEPVVSTALLSTVF